MRTDFCSASGEHAGSSSLNLQSYPAPGGTEHVRVAIAVVCGWSVPTGWWC